MADINFSKIEKKWQKRWETEKVFEVKDRSPDHLLGSGANKYYVLEMFPYPSGSGLHMGHAWNYTIGDILARFKIMNGFNVLHPMGYDSFGLPAENAAIEVGTHPEDYIKKTIKNYIKQQKAIGLSYDWSRMISSHEPSYYKWDQWIFLKMLEKGLAYQKVSSVNWCDKCNTVLANEQVENGRCWRHNDTEVGIKKLKQWFLKITDYANELYEGLDKMNWPERTKAMQKNWIGKSHGVEIDFEIGKGVGKGEISNVVIVHGSSPKDKEKMKEKKFIPKNEEHWFPWIKNNINKMGIECDVPLMPNSWKPKYEEWKREFEKLKIDENSILIGTSTGGAFLVRWLGDTKKRIKKLILVAPVTGKEKCNDWLSEFGNFKIDEKIKERVEEIIIFVSNDHDERIESANLYADKLNGRLIKLKNRGHFIEKHMGTKEFPELLKEINFEVEKSEISNVVIVHGSQFANKKGEEGFFEVNKQPWMLWIKDKMKSNVDIPLMPCFDNPVYEDWKKEFEKLKVNKDSVLIGHSLGGAFLVRWLGETKKRIKKLILVASVTGKEKCNDLLSEFGDFKIDERIKERVEEIIIFVSNDHDERIESANLYADKLNGRLIKLKNKGHFIKKHMGTNEFPELLREISNKSKEQVLILHGFGDNSKSGFIPWVKTSLEKRGKEVFALDLPNINTPDFDKWFSFVEREIKRNKLENFSIVGHSMGAHLALKLAEKYKIQNLLLISPVGFNSSEKYFSQFKNSLSKEKIKVLKNFQSHDLDIEKVKKNTKKINFVFGAEDPWINGEVVKFYKSNFKNIEILKGRRHLSADEDVEEVKELEKYFNDKSKTWSIFTTRPDTIFGVTFMVVSAQHPRLDELVTREQRKYVDKFLKKLKSVSEKDIGDLEKEGVFTGSYAVNPANGEKVPVYAGNFVVADYGAGMVMAVPAHDQRDFEFAKKYGLPVRRVVANAGYARSIVWGSDITKNDLETIGVKIIEEVKTKNDKYDEVVKKVEFPVKVADVFEKLIRDKLPTGFWNEYVGPNGVIFNFKNENGKVARLKLGTDNEKEIDKMCYEFFHNKKVGSKWKSKSVWKSLACAEDGFYKELLIHSNKGILINSGKFNELDSEKAKCEIAKWLIKKKLAKKVVKFKLRDWGISRQRYWGTPIPIIYCDECGAVPVPEKDLPIKLPKNVKFGKGNPLETAKDWTRVKCPKCGGKGKRETDTMDTFVNSSWYFLRYCDPKNNKVIFDKKKVDYWCPVDTYIGGAEHACMHLIYSRFYVKFLRDIGLLNFDEPAIRLFHQGMLHAEDGTKMSKSKGNIVLPEDISNKYGIDAARLFLSGIASPDKDIDWDERGIMGSLRFVNKITKLYENAKIGKDNNEVLSVLNKTIKDISIQLDNFDYRTSTIRLKELFDLLEKQNTISKKTLEDSLKMLNPFCPHITEELWEKMGNKNFISTSSWPKVNESKILKNIQNKNLDDKIIEDIKYVLKKIKAKKVYVYVMPFEIDKIDINNIKKVIGKKVIVYAVNDSKKYDPEKRAKKAKPGKATIYLE